MVSFFFRKVFFFVWRGLFVFNGFFFFSKNENELGFFQRGFVLLSVHGVLVIVIKEFFSVAFVFSFWKG